MSNRTMYRMMGLACSMAVALGVGRIARAEDVPVSGAPPLPEVIPGGECGPGVPQFTVGKGYRVTIAIDAPPESRFMEFDNYGHLYVSAPKHGTITVYELQPNRTYKEIAVAVKDKPTIHCMDFFDGWLWYTTSGAIFKGKVRADGMGLDEMTTVIPDDKTLPSGGSHWWRPILVDKDGFYTGIGEPRNISDQSATDREKIWRYSLDGKTRTLFVSGIRNTEKLRFRPGTNEVWGLDHGSDNFWFTHGEKKGNQPVTDRIPGEEINHYEAGKFYGHPFVVDANLIRPEFMKRPDIQQILAKSTPPEYMLPAHYADNGWTWLTKDTGFGKAGDMCIPSHGSWNSTVKVGYCVSLLHFDAKGKPVHAAKDRELFCSGWNNGVGAPCGRGGGAGDERSAFLGGCAQGSGVSPECDGGGDDGKMIRVAAF